MVIWLLIWKALDFGAKSGDATCVAKMESQEEKGEERMGTTQLGIKK